MDCNLGHSYSVSTSTLKPLGELVTNRAPPPAESR